MKRKEPKILEITLSGISLKIVDDPVNDDEVAFKDGTIIFGCPIDLRESRVVTVAMQENKYVSYHFVKTWRNPKVKGSNHK